MATTVLFLDTFTGPAGPLSGHSPEVGMALFPNGDLDGAGRLVQDGDGFLGAEVPGGAVELSDTYTATLKLVAPDTGAGVDLYGDYDPATDTNGGAASVLVSPAGLVRYGVATDGAAASIITSAVAVANSGVVTLSLSVGPTGTTILADGVLVASIPEFTTGSFGSPSLSMYAASEQGAVFDELSLTRITPDPVVPPDPVIPPDQPSSAVSLPPGLNTSWEAAQEVKKAVTGVSIGWSIFDGFTAGAEAPTTGAPVDSQTGTSGATWSSSSESNWY